MSAEEIKRLSLLKEKLLALKDYKAGNRLDFMRWELYPKQEDMLQAIINRLRTRVGPNIFVIFGGNRSGKSELGGGAVGEIFKQFKDLRIWCATLADLSIKVQQRKLLELVREVDIAYGDYNDIRGWKNKVILSKQNSKIFFKTYEQGAGAFQGDDIDVAWFDEECPYDVFSETTIRLADRSGIFILTFTSLQGFTRLVNRLYEADDPSIKSTVLTPFENPFLTQDAKDQLYANMDPDERESRWEGKPHIKQGLVYKEFNKGHLIPRFDYIDILKNHRDRFELSEGIDPHVRTPHHWLKFMYDKHEDILYIVEEIKAPKESMLVADFSKLIKLKRFNITPVYTQIDTSSETPSVVQVHKDEYQEDIHTIRSEFSKSGIKTILCSKDNAIGINAVKNRLKTVKTKDGTIKRKPKIYVFDDLKGVRSEFARYSWDTYISVRVEERKEQINRVQKKDDHYMDIIKYECIKRALDRPDEFKHEMEEMYDGIGY